MTARKTTTALNRQIKELTLLLREVMRWEKLATSNRFIEHPMAVGCMEVFGDLYMNGEVTRTGASRTDDDDAWGDLHDILNRAHVAVSTDEAKRPRQRPQAKQQPKEKLDDGHQRRSTRRE